jgi:Tol biopolymer transport system component
VWVTGVYYNLELNVSDLQGNHDYGSGDAAIEFIATNALAVAHNINPEWNPALNTVIFASDRLGDYDIFRVDADGTDLEALRADPGDQLHPTVSSDGQLLAWQGREEEGDWDVFVAPLGEDANPIVVTPEDSAETEPRFSRTSSRQIFCVSDRLTTTQIFRLGPDGSGFAPLSQSFGSAQFSPSPHPLIDNQLLFSSPRAGSSDIWSMSVSAVDGSLTSINQTNSLADADSQPDWGADASYFIYVSDQGGTSNLWLGDLTGNNRRVTDFELTLADPSASPFSGDGRCAASLARTDGGSDIVIIDLVSGSIAANLTGTGAGD